MQVTDLLHSALPHYLPAGLAIESFPLDAQAKYPRDAVHAFLQAMLHQHSAIRAYDVYFVDHQSIEAEYQFADGQAITSLPLPQSVRQMGVRLFYQAGCKPDLLSVFLRLEEGLLACRL